MPENKTDYKIPQAKELKMGMCDAHALSEFLSYIEFKYDFGGDDYEEVQRWKKLLEPKEIA